MRLCAGCTSLHEPFLFSTRNKMYTYAYDLLRTAADRKPSAWKGGRLSVCSSAVCHLVNGINILDAEHAECSDCALAVKSTPLGQLAQDRVVLHADAKLCKAGRHSKRPEIIVKFNLKTPGREDDDDIEAEKKITISNANFAAVAAGILEGLGGKDNITSVDNCITRLRLEIKNYELVNDKKIKAAGAAGVMRPSKTSVQVIIGTQVQFVADEFKKLL